MRKLIAIFGILGFVATLGVSSAPADDYLTGCVKDGKKNTKLKRVALGTDPGSSCKSKETEVTLATAQLADSLQSQINQNANDIDTNTANIATNTNDIADNADMIAAIKEGLISSMIGGGHDSTSDGGRTIFMPLFNWFAGDTDPAMASKVAVTGWLTNLVAIQNEATGGGALQTYQYIVNGAPVDLSPLVADNFCVTTGATGDDSTMCQSEGCFKINQGDTLSVREVAADAGSPPHVSPTRWTGRFVETDAECPAL